MPDQADYVEAVLFDFGGTLFDYGCLRQGAHAALVRMCRSAGLEPDDRELAAAYIAALRRAFTRYLPVPFYLMRDLFRAAAVDTLEWLDALDGVTRSAATAGPSLLAGVDDAPAALQHTEDLSCDPFLEATDRDFRLYDGVTATLAALRRRGVRVGLATNMDADQMAHLVGLSGLEPHLDVAVSSEEARSCKPDPGMFTEALRRIGAPPSATLFVGDSLSQDIAGANRAGLRSVLVWAREGDAPPRMDPGPDFVVNDVCGLLPLLNATA
jgi:HAD superfamily hydrolase (TIGR01662 family)